MILERPQNYPSAVDVSVRLVCLFALISRKGTLIRGQSQSLKPHHPISHVVADVFARLTGFRDD